MNTNINIKKSSKQYTYTYSYIESKCFVNLVGREKGKGKGQGQMHIQIKSSQGTYLPTLWMDVIIHSFIDNVRQGEARQGSNDLIEHMVAVGRYG